MGSYDPLEPQQTESGVCDESDAGIKYLAKSIGSSMFSQCR